MKAMLLISVILVFSGCSALREAATDISGEEVLNLGATRKVAIDYVTIWPMQSGFIKGVLGTRMDEMPAQDVEAIEELDQIAELINGMDPNDVKDHDLGKSLGLRLRLLGSVVKEALKRYAPSAVEYITLLF